jgi:DNA modification methylase
MINHGGLAYDPFVGSGTTVIAAEQLNRICYAMEIEPAYCDVIRRRYSEFVNDPKLAP